jgi:hypothetical protein
MWRMTAPLRNALNTLKALRQRGNDWRMGVKRLPQQVNVARQILKEEGAVALGRRVQEKLAGRGEGPAVAVDYRAESEFAPLIVPFSERPEFSIIVPVYEQHLLTFTCLKSLAATVGRHAVEVIVIDDCSPTPAAEALKDVSGVRFVRNETNLGPGTGRVPGPAQQRHHRHRRLAGRHARTFRPHARGRTGRRQADLSR